MTVRRSAGLLVAAVLILAGCQGFEQTVSGEISDDAITLSADTASQSVWLELSNVGTDPCELVVVLTEAAPDALPTSGGRVELSQTNAPGEPYNAEGYAEIDGEPQTRGDHGFQINPGQTARVQVALTGTPERAERVVLCNGDGDYAAGRYAYLLFTR